MEKWWENLDKEQKGRLLELVNSRTRLFGESFESALEACTERIHPENLKWVMEG